MIPATVPALRLNHALTAAALVLAALAAWPWLVPPVASTRTVAVPPAGAPAPALSALPPLASYSAIVERPLFAPSRRPPPGAEVTSGPSIESRYRLLGIVATGPRKVAFIAEGTRRIEIAEGDVLDSWTVKTIAQDRVLLSSPAGDAALRLKSGAAEPQKSQ